MQKTNCKNQFLNRIKKLKENGILINESFQKVSQKVLENINEREIKICEELIFGERKSVEINGIPFHSRRDPDREANRQIESLIKKNGRHIIFISSGLGYLLDKAIKNENIQSVLLIETNSEIFFYLINFLEEQTLKTKLNIFFVENIQTVNFEEILFFLRGKNSSEMLIHTHHPAYVSNERDISRVSQRVKGLLEKRSINQATIIKFQKQWNRNIILNLKEITEGGRKKDLLEYLKLKFPEKDVMIAGAGPSLSDSIDEIKKFRNHFLLFAADTAFLPLISSGILPDVVFAADPQWVNLYFAHSEYASHCAWILDPVVVSPMAHFLKMQDALLFWWDNEFFLDARVRKYFGNRGVVSHGGSVSTNAFSIAKELRPEKIVLIGQDLSFSDKTAHVKGAALEKRIFFLQNRLNNMENHNYKQMTALPKEKVLSINPKLETFTNAKMKVFIEWFQNAAYEMKHNSHPSRRINATTTGTMLQNFEHIPLSKIYPLPNNATQPNENLIDLNFLREAIQDISYEKKEPRDRFVDYLNITIRSISNLLPLYEKSINLNKKLQTTQNASIMNQLMQNDKKIQSYKDENSFISLGAQNEILQITEYSDENISAEASAIKLYTALWKSGRELHRLLKKSVNILS